MMATSPAYPAYRLRSSAETRAEQWSRLRHYGRWLLFCFLLCELLLLQLLAGVTAPGGEPASGWRMWDFLMGSQVILCLLVLRWFNFSWLSGPMIYVCFFWLHHLSLLTLLSIDPDQIHQLPELMYGWTTRSTWHLAGFMSLMVMLSFTCGACLAKPVSAAAGRAERSGRFDHRLFAIGLVIGLAGFGLVIYAVVQGGGFAVFRSSYSTLFDSVFGQAYGNGFLLAACGFIAACAGATRKGVLVVMAIQGALCVLLLLLGARGPAMVPVLAIAVILAKRGYRFRLLPTIAAIVAMLWILAYIGVNRNTNLLTPSFSWTMTSPVRTVAEMGGSLHTVSLVLQWTDGGDQLQYGRGYLLPFERFAGLIVPGVRRDLATDARNLSSVLVSRETALGGSAVAEAYYNFGAPGSVLIFAPLGWLIGWLDRRAHSCLRIAAYGGVLFVAYFNVRNWFIAVPAQLTIALLPFVCTQLLAGMRFASRKAGF
jgi:hypothetical protein